MALHGQLCLKLNQRQVNACLYACVYACSPASQVLPRDSFTSSHLQCQLLAISFCNKVSHMVISVQHSWDVTQFKQPPREGKLRIMLRVLASTFPCTGLFHKRHSGPFALPRPPKTTSLHEHARAGSVYSTFGTPRFHHSDTREPLRLAETPETSSHALGLRS